MKWKTWNVSGLYFIYFSEMIFFYSQIIKICVINWITLKPQYLCIWVVLFLYYCINMLASNENSLILYEPQYLIQTNNKYQAILHQKPRTFTEYPNRVLKVEWRYGEKFSSP